LPQELCRARLLYFRIFPPLAAVFTNMALRLFTAGGPADLAAQKVLVAGAYAGVQVEVTRVDPAAAAKHPAVLASPFRQLPVLQTRDGRVLPRSNAILRYVAGLRADAGFCWCAG
jgi:hypothetical protein